MKCSICNADVDEGYSDWDYGYCKTCGSYICCDCERYGYCLDCFNTLPSYEKERLDNRNYRFFKIGTHIIFAIGLVFLALFIILILYVVINTYSKSVKNVDSFFWLFLLFLTLLPILTILISNKFNKKDLKNN